MDFLWEALIAGGGALAVGGSYLAGRKTSKPKAAQIKMDDIPLIEIDGKLVPHPTIVEQRLKRGDKA